MKISRSQTTGKTVQTAGSHSATLLRSISRLVRYAYEIARLGACLAWRSAAHRERSRTVLAREFASLLNRLGATPIKLGQLIASTPGSFPQDIVEACSALRDQVPPDSFDIYELLLAELGPRATAIRDLDPSPIAAASIAQVHVGHLTDGRKVAVKVQRPSVAAALTADARLLRKCARIAARLVPSLARVDLVGQVDDLCDQLTAELDFESELLNARVLAEALAGSDIAIPTCIETLCTPRVLVMEFVPGTALTSCLDDLVALNLGTDVARQILRALLWPLVSRGAFHADMHGGNILVGQNARVCMVDFGSVCHVQPASRTQLIETLTHLFDRKFDQAAWNMLSLVDVSNADLLGAQQALAAIAADSLDRSIEDVPLGQVVKEILAAGTTYGIVMPAALTAMLRQMVLLDGSIRLLDPDFNVFDEGAAILRSFPKLTALESDDVQLAQKIPNCALAV